MMPFIQKWEIFSRIRNLLILCSGPTTISVTSPSKYIYVITMLALHVSSLKWVLFEVTKTWYQFNLFALYFWLFLVLGIFNYSLQMGGESRKQESKKCDDWKA